MIGPKFPESSRTVINIYLETQSDRDSVSTSIYGFTNRLSDFFSAKITDKNIKFYYEGQYIDLSPESLLKGFLKKKEDTGKEYDFQFMNYIVFKISEKRKNQLPFDKALSVSFDAKLKNNGLNEKKRLLNCIKMVNRIKKGSAKTFFSPFLNVFQSSGSGKTKIATELMFEIPSFYLVFREEVSDKETLERAQGGYPHMSDVSRLFLNLPFQTRDDSAQLKDNPTESTVGRYILLLKALFSDYIDTFRTLSAEGNGTFESVLGKMFHKIMNGTFMGKELNLFCCDTNWNSISINKTTHKFSRVNDSISNLDFVPLTMENAIKACQELLKEIYAFQRDIIEDGKNPFVLIVDEASLLSTSVSPNGISRFRLFRRAVNRLGPESDFAALTLGTNSDILDLNPILTIDSFRFLASSGVLYPPFLLSRNWDLLMDYKELDQLPIGYHEMLRGRMIIFWFSLGRPLWSSLSFSRLNHSIRIKITNNSIKSGEAYIAFWMVRVGLMVNPANVITHHLVKSLMATLLHISPGLRSMRVHYPSEPALAIGVRSILMTENHLDDYYSALEKFIKARAIDTGRFSEIISGDICLLAISNAKDRKMKCTWNYDEKIPKVCKTNYFILETSEFHTNESKNIIEEREKNENQQDRNENLRQYFEGNYIIIEGKEFIIGMYGEIVRRVVCFIPELIKTGLLNMTHYTQVSNKFPFESLKTKDGKIFEATKPPLADPLYGKGNGLCNLITAEVLESMIIRGSGIMLAPCTFGLDHMIPICFKPDGDEIFKSTENVESGEKAAQNAMEVDPAEDSQAPKDIAVRPEYSFIGVQVKRGISENIRTIMAKGAVSNHYVRCGLHGANDCTSQNCKFRISDQRFKRLLENGFTLIHCFTEIETNSYSNNEETNDSAAKRAKTETGEILCETSLPGSDKFFEDLKKLKIDLKDGIISQDEYIQGKKAIDVNLRELIKDLCPAEFIEKIDDFKFDALKSSNYEKTRFIPDLYLSYSIYQKMRERRHEE